MADPNKDACHRCGALNCGRLQRALNAKRPSIVEERECSLRENALLRAELKIAREALEPVTRELAALKRKQACDCKKCRGTGTLWEGMQSFACIGCQGRECGHYPYTVVLPTEAVAGATTKGR